MTTTSSSRIRPTHAEKKAPMSTRSSPRNFRKTLGIASVLVGAALVLLSCKSGERSSSSSSAFSNKVVPVADVPKGPHTFRWDFSKEKTWSYTYSQHMKNQSDMEGSKDTMDADAKGTMDVVSKGGGTANLVLRDVEMQMASKTGQSDQMPQKLPTQVVPGIKEDGSMDEGGNPGAALMKVLVPLPRRALEIGESDEVPVSFPFNAGGSPLTIRGTAKVTLTGFARVHDRTCAVLEAILDVSRLDVPPELRGSYQGSLKGTSTLCFDLTENALVSGKVAIVLSTKAEMPGGDGQTSKIAMTMDTLITLDRQGL
ncbi:MAG: hypothetical protein NT062_05525 [Proteobacteria bacterium]|nr:hypothetical protein [Pseudomonadota bacterium]